MVKSSGRPAATRLPKAMIKMMIVTGHESISERNMAERLAVLKLAQRALSPVNVTATLEVESLLNGVATASAACTILLESAADPAVMTAVRPSRDSETPACGGTTVDTRGSLRSTSVALTTMAWACGSDAIGPWWSTTTTCRPVAPRPEKFFSMMARAATDWLFEACHPAPASAFSTWMAKKPKPRSTRSHATSTRRKCVAAQRPSRANGPGPVPWAVASSARTPSGVPADGSATPVPAATSGASRPAPRVVVMRTVLCQTGIHTRRSGARYLGGYIEL